MLLAWSAKAVAVDRVRVVIADDHDASLSVFTRMLQREFDVIGTAINGKDAVAAVGALKPDIVVLDIEMPVMDGLAAARTLIDSGCLTRIIFLTVHADPDYIQAAMKMGAAGYVLKSRATLELPLAVRMVMRGESFITPGAGAEK